MGIVKGWGEGAQPLPSGGLGTMLPENFKKLTVAEMQL